jgi:hypothetical protein
MNDVSMAIQEKGFRPGMSGTHLIEGRERTRGSHEKRDQEECQPQAGQGAQNDNRAPMLRAESG